MQNRSRTFFIVDDNATQRRNWKLRVKSYFGHIIEAGNPSEALEKLREHALSGGRIDVAVIDLRMPIEGLEERWDKEIDEALNSAGIEVLQAVRPLLVMPNGEGVIVQTIHANRERLREDLKNTCEFLGAAFVNRDRSGWDECDSLLERWIPEFGRIHDGAD